MNNRTIKVLIAKPGLDGHDRGAKIIVRALMEAGMEVIYTGIRQTPEDIVAIALEEAVDVVGLSILSGAHMELFPRIIEGLHERGMSNAIVVTGGIIPDSDRKSLEKMGVVGIFGPGTSTVEIAEFIDRAVAERDKRQKQKPKDRLN
tara:strand:- start:16025 stop:16465 length:441 start_codon:yes stop_codon:yes gene_type:complete